MRDFDPAQMPNINSLPQFFIDKIASLAVFVVVGKAGYLGIGITAILFMLSLFIALPFSPMWGFATVPVGALVGLFVGHSIRKGNLNV